MVRKYRADAEASSTIFVETETVGVKQKVEIHKSLLSKQLYLIHNLSPNTSIIQV
uniref:Uncharacterized protein n=1 Tax=Arion vulgaris TaxID=1028688 RepID=A0A0B7A1J9_9EUPU